MRKKLQFSWVVTFLLMPLDLPFFEWMYSVKLDVYARLCSIFNCPFPAFFSDSLGFWFLLGFLFLGAFSVSFLIKRSAFYQTEWSTTLEVLMALVLIKYGLDKLWMQQFPRPEINLLYQDLRMFDKDILFWTALGTSKFFNYSTGLLELFTGIFLLFDRLKSLGRLLALLCFLTIAGLNLSFNIGVKGFSIFLLFGAFVQAWPTVQLHFSFLFTRNKEGKKGLVFKISCLAVVLLFLSLDSVEKEKKLFKPRLFKVEENTFWEKVFVSRQGFFILQDRGGNQRAYSLLNQNVSSLEIMNDQQKTEILRLKKDASHHILLWKGKEIVLTEMELPEISDDFNWVVK